MSGVDYDAANDARLGLNASRHPAPGRPPYCSEVYGWLLAVPEDGRWAAIGRASAWANESRRVGPPAPWSDWDFVGAWILGACDGMRLGEAGIADLEVRVRVALSMSDSACKSRDLWQQRYDELAKALHDKLGPGERLVIVRDP